MHKEIKMMTLFSGYESQMMALQMAISQSSDNIIADLVGWSDISKTVQAVHNAVYPEYAERCYPDVTQIKWEEIEDIDILFASSPCQDVSRLGGRRGMEKDSATRSSLVWEVEKAIAIKRPKWFIEENVEGMLDNLKDFESLVRAISSYGYACFFKVLRGAEFGIPQNRPRMFLVAIRIDDKAPNPIFNWPEPIKQQSKPEDLLSKNVDDKYYLTVEETNTYIDLVRNADKGYETECSSNGKSPRRFQNSQFTKHLSSFVTPVCKDGSIPTLTASGHNGSLESIAGCRRENHACVIEIWEGALGLQPIMTNEKAISKTIKALKKSPDKERVLNAISNLKENQYLRIRHLTPAECLRFMGVEEEYICRVIPSYDSSSQDGYTDQHIKKKYPSRKSGGFSDYVLYERAGNSIIVNVIAAIFSKVLEYYSDKESETFSRASLSSSKAGGAMTLQEKKRLYSRNYYQRNREEVRRKSREYHRKRREKLRIEKQNAA